MSDDHGHRHKSEGGGAARWMTIGGWAIAALLGANLAVGQFRTGESQRPEGFLSEQLVLAVAFWVPLAVIAAAAGFGTYWTVRTAQRREKSSLVWTRNSFIFGLALALLLVVAVQDPKIFKREWLAAWAAFLIAVQLCFFAYAAFREYRHTVGGGGSGGGRRRSSDRKSDDAALPETGEPS